MVMVDGGTWYVVQWYCTWYYSLCGAGMHDLICDLLSAIFTVYCHHILHSCLSSSLQVKTTVYCLLSTVYMYCMHTTFCCLLSTCTRVPQSSINHVTTTMWRCLRCKRRPWVLLWVMGVIFSTSDVVLRPRTFASDQRAIAARRSRPLTRHAMLLPSLSRSSAQSQMPLGLR